jgi:hypothetical protein
MRLSLRIGVSVVGLIALCQGEVDASSPSTVLRLAARPPLEVVAELEKEGSLTSLTRAVILRRAHWARDPQILADIERGLALLSTKNASAPFEVQAAEDFLVDALDLNESVSDEVWQPFMRRYIQAMTSAGQSALRLRAQVRLAAHLWERSCPIAGQDGACIERSRAESLCRKASQGRVSELVETRGAKRVREFLCDLPRYVYRVHARNGVLAALAQGLIKDALHYAEGSKLIPQQPGDAIADALAHARFLQAEPYFEAALATTRYPGAPATLDPSEWDPNNPKELKRAKDQFGRWWEKRLLNLSTLRDQAVLERPLAYPETRWAIAAHARLGQLFMDITDQITACKPPALPPPPPPGMAASDWENHFEPSGCGCWVGDPPYVQKMNHHLQACSDLSMESLLDTPQTRFCQEAVQLAEPSYLHAQMPEISPCLSWSCTGSTISPSPPDSGLLAPPRTGS